MQLRVGLSGPALFESGPLSRQPGPAHDQEVPVVGPVHRQDHSADVARVEAQAGLADP